MIDVIIRVKINTKEIFLKYNFKMILLLFNASISNGGHFCTQYLDMRYGFDRDCPERF